MSVLLSVIISEWHFTCFIISAWHFTSVSLYLHGILPVFHYICVVFYQCFIISAWHFTCVSLYLRGILPVFHYICVVFYQCFIISAWHLIRASVYLSGIFTVFSCFQSVIILECYYIQFIISLLAKTAIVFLLFCDKTECRWCTIIVHTPVDVWRSRIG